MNGYEEYIKEHIKEYLPSEFGEARVSIKKETKNNDRSVTLLTIMKPGENINPAIHIDKFVKQIHDGRDLDAVMWEIANIRVTYKCDKSWTLNNYEIIKPLLSIQICDTENNIEYLKDKPHIPFGDFSIFYRIQTSYRDDGIVSAAINNDTLKLWGITKERLHKDTISAEKNRNSVCLYNIEDMLNQAKSKKEPENLFGQEQIINTKQHYMYVLTNRDKTNGAGVLAIDGVLEKIGKSFNSDFYVLPSSVHEVIILPDIIGMDLATCEGIVKDINAAMVAPGDRLSDKVQRYDRATKTLKRE